MASDVLRRTALQPRRQRARLDTRGRAPHAFGNQRFKLEPVAEFDAA
jgi:hypothetical protein